MKNLFKGKFGTILVIIATLILAGAAIYTAIRLYQLRQQPVAPNVPSSIPQAAEVPSSCTKLAFNVGTSTPTPTPTPTTPSSCNSICTGDSDCSSGLTCSGGFCRNPSCTDAADCTCQSTETPTPTPTSTSTAAPNSCGGTCGSNANCSSDLVCYNGFCRNPSCTTASDCVCGTAAPTTQPSLPQSGTDWPTVLGMGVGILTIIGSLLLAI